jgi:hypothetical protein
MANRSLLFAASHLPAPGRPHPTTLGLAEFGYDIPIIFRALLSPAPQGCRSMIFEMEHDLAIGGLRDEGVARLEALRDALGPDHPNGQALDAALAFLARPQVRQFGFVVLEPLEILDLERRPLEASHADLLAQISALTPDALLAAARQRSDPGAWGADCWSHILSYDTQGAQMPDLDPADGILFTNPAHLLRQAPVLPACTELTQVSVELGDDPALAGEAIATLAAVPQPFHLTLSCAGQDVPASVMELPNLIGLGIRQMGPTGLPATVASAPILEGLYLQNNGLTQVPEAVRAMRSLKTLSIWGNPLGSLPDWIGELSQLESLMADASGLRTLPDSLFTLANLSDLSVKHNPELVRLPDQLGRLAGLTCLNVTDCGLTALPDVFDRLPALQQLYAGSNRLTALPPSLKRARLSVLSLVGNPLRRPLFGRWGLNARQIYWK